MGEGRVCSFHYIDEEMATSLCCWSERIVREMRDRRYKFLNLVSFCAGIYSHSLTALVVRTYWLYMEDEEMDPSVLIWAGVSSARHFPLSGHIST